jgi:hypothetical protein
MNHIHEIVLNYIESTSSNPYAILINGEWGSGKTYFLKKNIKCKLEELNYKVLYVSLNGVSSIQEIYSQLASEKSRTLKFFKDNKAARIGLKIANSVGDVFLRAIRYDVSDDNKSIGDVDPNSGDIPKLSIKDFLNFENCVICFDDLERVSSKLKIEDVLGFINTNFVEHERLKVIILCDEKNIEKAQWDNYKRKKEKVIGRTILFKKDIKSFLNNWINEFQENNPDSKLTAFLKKEKEFLIDRVLQSKQENLRNILFAFDILKDIIEIKGVNKLLNDLGQSIILSVLSISFTYKGGYFEDFNDFRVLPDLITQEPLHFYIPVDNTESSWKSAEQKFKEKYKELTKEEMENKLALDFVFAKKYRFRADGVYKFFVEIFNYIKTGFLNEEKLLKELKEKLPKVKPPHIFALSQMSISNVGELSDVDFNNYYSKIIEGIKNSEYNIVDFIWASINLINIKKLGIILPMDDKMLNKFLIEGIDTINRLPSSNLFPYSVNSYTTGLKKDFETFPIFSKKAISKYLQAYDNSKSEEIDEMFLILKNDLSNIPAQGHLETFLILGKGDQFCDLILNSIKFDSEKNQLLWLFGERFLDTEIYAKSTNLTEGDIDSILKAIQFMINKLNIEYSKMVKKEVPMSLYHLNKYIQVLSKIEENMKVFIARTKKEI